MSLINEKYDRVICINLKERPDKKKFIQAQLNKYNILFEFFHPVILGYSQKFIDPYTNEYNSGKWPPLFNKQFPNEFGTLHSHYYVIKSALLDGIQNLFIFEDDCAFHKDWDNLLPKYMNTIPNDMDGILLYSYMSKLEPQNTRVKPRWTKGFMSWSLLAYGMNRKAMEGFINLVDSMPMIADRVSWEMMTNKGYNFYIASPPLILPAKELSSNIRGENKNYEKTKSIYILGINEEDYK